MLPEIGGRGAGPAWFGLSPQAELAAVSAPVSEPVSVPVSLSQPIARDRVLRGRGQVSYGAWGPAGRTLDIRILGGKQIESMWWLEWDLNPHGIAPNGF